MLNESYWYKRGVEDARKDVPPLFRNTTRNGIHGVLDTPEGWTRDDEIGNGRAYLNGYNSEAW